MIDIRSQIICSGRESTAGKNCDTFGSLAMQNRTSIVSTCLSKAKIKVATNLDSPLLTPQAHSIGSLVEMLFTHDRTGTLAVGSRSRSC